ncbi:hypothetical protein [Janthinobacterium sp. BJB304]|uniref:hypothetical protein n=1 Tax=Janthinobacterium sp. BJB304 TaxID=1572871 RepID=UPI00117A0246|nr:hypothetical protein [Janthinobacterium sp. BJB304]
MIWIAAGVVLLFLVRHLWKIYNHPSNVMTRQAAHMNWVVAGRVKNDNGGNDLLLSRNSYTARIAWQDGTPTLVKPPCTEHFSSFIAIEHWICKAEKGTKPLDIPGSFKEYEEQVLDALTLRDATAVDAYDVYMHYLEVSTSDFDYLNASLELMHDGYQNGIDPAIIGSTLIKALLTAPKRGEKPSAVLRRVASLG